MKVKSQKQCKTAAVILTPFPPWPGGNFATAIGNLSEPIDVNDDWRYLSLNNLPITTESLDLLISAENAVTFIVNCHTWPPQLPILQPCGRENVASIASICWPSGMWRCLPSLKCYPGEPRVWGVQSHVHQIRIREWHFLQLPREGDAAMDRYTGTINWKSKSATYGHIHLRILVTAKTLKDIPIAPEKYSPSFSQVIILSVDSCDRLVQKDGEELCRLWIGSVERWRRIVLFGESRLGSDSSKVPTLPISGTITEISTCYYHLGRLTRKPGIATHFSAFQIASLHFTSSSWTTNIGRFVLWLWDLLMTAAIHIHLLNLIHSGNFLNLPILWAILLIQDIPEIDYRTGYTSYLSYWQTR